MADVRKMANNILEFLLDPTVIPVTQRLYFGPGERLQNEFYTDAKADAAKAYGDQKKNSDFYPERNRQQSQREAGLMDRKTIIASMDILAQSFVEGDPIAKDLTTMAYAIDKMGEEAFQARLAAKTFKCPTCGTKVLEQTSYCVKCKKKVKAPGADKKADQNSPHPQQQSMAPAPVAPEATPAPEAPAKEEGKEASSLGKWNKRATDMVRKALISEVVASDDGDKDDKPVDAPAKDAPVPAEEPKECKAAAPVAPAPAPKAAAEVPQAPIAPAPVAPVAPAPAAEEPKKDAPKKENDEGKEAKTVDTSILGFDMAMPFMTAEDVGVLADDEKARLESIMSTGFDLTAEQKDKVGLK